jgi:hypothetical protein
MVPLSYKGTISQNAQEAVLIHDGNREDLVLRINYQIKGDTLPENFAWIITVPNEPDAYAVADETLFEDMFNLSQRLLVPPPPRSSKMLMANSVDSLSLDSGVELGKRVEVGPYDIQPVRGVGPNALTGLNAWLKENGFPTEDPDHMKWFVDNKFTFLAIKVSAAKGSKTVGDGGDLPPMHLSFKSESPYYPLRFSSRQGIFDVNLHILTRDKFDYEKSSHSLKKINWSDTGLKQNVKLMPSAMPDSLKKLFADSPWKEDIGAWRYNNLRCYNVNQNNTISQWTEDIAFVTR